MRFFVATILVLVVLVLGAPSQAEVPAGRRYVVAAIGDSLTDTRSGGGKYLKLLGERCPRRGIFDQDVLRLVLFGKQHRAAFEFRVFEAAARIQMPRRVRWISRYMPIAIASPIAMTAKR